MVKALLGRKRAEGLSEKTVAKIRRIAHAMFALAQDARLVAVGPGQRPRKRGEKQRRRAKGTVLTRVQIKRFLHLCSDRWLFFVVALDTGLRRGELVGLRRGDTGSYLGEQPIVDRRKNVP
jgi:integrase